MLQIVSGKFFRPVDLYETLHRQPLFTNYRAFHDTVWTLPVGELRFSSGSSPKTIFAEILEKLEAVGRDGEPEVMIATSGSELISDVADVLAFRLNIICTQNHDLAQRLVLQPGIDANSTPWLNRKLRQTFDNLVVSKDSDEQVVTEMIAKLISLDRKTYKAVVRAIKRCVVATHRVQDDISLAYTLIVAALESLAKAVEPPPEQWTDYEEPKRKRIDDALVGADESVSAAVRTAILENEHTALRRRFVNFVVSNIAPSFYRDEAADCPRPVRAADIPAALKEAYDIRSRTMHQLKELAPEAHSMGDLADTAWVEGKTVLTIEGLYRLARHVILEALRTAKPGDGEDFNYRQELPGLITGRLHSQYWIWRTDGFDPAEAHERLSGFLEQVLPVMAGEPGAQLTDIRPLLKLYEKRIAQSAPEPRRSMIGLYFLWHLLVRTEDRLPTGAKFVKRHGAAMEEPSVVSLILHILTRRRVDWPTEALLEVERTYWRGRANPRGLRLPAQLEAGMAIVVAERLEDEGRLEEAYAAADRAVGAMPGARRIMNYEAALHTKSMIPYTILGLVLDRTEVPEDEKGADDAVGEEE